MSAGDDGRWSHNIVALDDDDANVFTATAFDGQNTSPMSISITVTIDKNPTFTASLTSFATILVTFSEDVKGSTSVDD